MVGGVGESVGALLGATVSWHVLGDLGAPQPATHTYCGAHWHSQSPFTMAQMPPGFVSQLCWSPLQVTKVGAAVGVGEEQGVERARFLEKAGADVIVIDTAHGHSKNVGETLKTIKKKV